MKQSVATYLLGVLLGSVLGLGSLVAAGSNAFFVFPTRFEVLTGEGSCTTVGGIPSWTGTSVTNMQTVNALSSNMWVKCENLTGTSIALDAMEKLDVRLYDRSFATSIRAKAYTECVTEDATHASIPKSLPSASTNLQNLAFIRPWSSACTKTSVNVLLPRRTASGGSQLKYFVAYSH
jgi:hypothetical protein